MKSLNLKKVAAVAAGLALVAGSVAAAVSWSDLVNTSNHTMKMAGIVVGDTAKATDTLAANNLAKALAKKAIYTTTTTEDVNTKSCTTTPGTDVKPLKKIEGKALHTTKVSSDNFPSSSLLAKNSNVGKVLTQDSSMSYKVGGSTYTTSVTEKVSLGAEALFDKRYDVDKLGLAYDSGDFKYNIKFGDLNFAKDSDYNGSGTWTDDTDDKVTIPFMGKKYEVYSINDDPKTVVLVNSNAMKSYQKGDKITNLKGKDGKDYYATIDDVIYNSRDPDTIIMTLYDASTNKAVSDDSYVHVKVSEGESFAEDFLTTGVDVHEVDNVGNGTTPEYMIDILVGNDKLTIEDGKGFPYDTTKTKTRDYDWKADVNITNGVLKNITIENTSSNDRSYTDKNMLAPGETTWMFNKLLGVRFDGLELPAYSDYASNIKDVADLNFTDSLENSDNMPGILYYGTDDALHELPFYYKLPLDETDDGNSGATFTLDGQDKVLKLDDANDQNYLVYTATGDDIDTTDYGSTPEIHDWNYRYNGADVNNIYLGTALAFKNSNDDNVYFYIGYDDQSKVAYLFLAGDYNYNMKTPGKAYGAFELIGTDENYNSSYSQTGAYYIPHLEGEVNDLNEVHFTDNEISAALFTVDENDTSFDDFNLYINTETSKAPLVGEGGATNDIPTGYQIINGTIEIKDGKDTGISYAYDAFGTKFGVLNDEPYFEIPEAEARPQVHFVVSGGEGEETCTYSMVSTPVDKNVAYSPLDDPTNAFAKPIKPADRVADEHYIVIGGYIVNQAFADVAADANAIAGAFGEGQALAKEGDSVTQVLNGNLYIAGYTADDTTKAVKALIDVLDNEPLE